MRQTEAWRAIRVFPHKSRGDTTVDSMESASIHVFRLQELLEKIFFFLEKPQLLNCALVSKSWSEPALDNLWAKIDDIFLLFRILGPIGPVSALW